MIDLLKTRRSIRVYEDKKIDKESVELILKAALLSPSSKGRRPWSFIVVSNKEVLNSLSRCRTKGGGPFIKNSSDAIVVISDKSKTEDVWIEDCAIATTIMQLEAHKLGIGSCWVQIRNRMHDDEKTAEEYIKELLNIEDNYAVECILSLGYSAENKKSYSDDDLDWEKVRRIE